MAKITRKKVSFYGYFILGIVLTLSINNAFAHRSPSFNACAKAAYDAYDRAAEKARKELVSNLKAENENAARRGERIMSNYDAIRGNYRGKLKNAEEIEWKALVHCIIKHM